MSINNADLHNVNNEWQYESILRKYKNCHQLLGQLITDKLLSTAVLRKFF